MAMLMSNAYLYTAAIVVDCGLSWINAVTMSWKTLAMPSKHCCLSIMQTMASEFTSESKSKNLQDIRPLRNLAELSSTLTSLFSREFTLLYFANWPLFRG